LPTYFFSASGAIIALEPNTITIFIPKNEKRKKMCNFVGYFFERKMKQKLFNIFQRSWELMLSTSTAWNTIEQEDNTKNQVVRQFIYPWIIICALLVMAFDMIYSSGSIIKAGFISGLTTIISYLGAFYTANYLSFRFLNNKFNGKYQKNDNEKIIAYSFTIIFIIKIITSAIPSLFFLKILNIYTIYLVWDACRAILKLDDEERGNYVLITTGLILLSPFIFNKILGAMLP